MRWPDGWPVGLALLLLVAWVTPLRADVEPYSARYSVYRNGILSGKAEVELQFGESGWTISSDGNGTHGLAKALGARDTEESSGQYLEGRLVPEHYRRLTRLAGIEENWQAEFDWTGEAVRITNNGDVFDLELTRRAVDPLTLKIELRQRLAAGNSDLQFWMIDEDEIEDQLFRSLESEKLETSLGCLDTIPVERVRSNSTRYTRAWHATELGYVAVRMEHGKTDGDHMEMRITELVLAGERVTPQPGCSAKQRPGRASPGRGP
jgi:hypothetical protein